MKTIRLIQLIFLSILFIPVMLTAQQVSEVRETDPFSGIDVSSVFKVELIQGENHFVEVTADEKHLENIETNVEQGVLKVSFDGRTRNFEARLMIISPEIHSIQLSGATSLEGGTLIESPSLAIRLSGASSSTIEVNTPSLETRVSGASSINITGQAESHQATASGASQIRAGELSTETTLVKTSGASNATITAVQHIDATASGTSRIVFDAEPLSQEIKTSGMGSVNDKRVQTTTSAVRSDNDTTRIRLGHREFLVFDEEGSIRTKTRHRKTFRNNWSGFEMGINGYLTPDFDMNLQGDAELIDLRYEKSVIVNINLFQQSFPIISNNLGVFTGFGLSFNNYRFDNQTRIIHTRPELIFVEDTLPMMKNKLTLTYLTVPLMLEFQTHGNKTLDRFHLAGGMILGTRIGTHAKYVYDDNGKKRKVKDYNNFHVPPFRFDATARIGWGRINLFATYALNTLFAQDKGPELYPFSVGIRLINF